jgi:hypothetical protein
MFLFPFLSISPSLYLFSSILCYIRHILFFDYFILLHFCFYFFFVLFNKSARYAAAFAVTKFILIISIYLVTLTCIFSQGTLTEVERLSTFDLLINVTCFVTKENNIFNMQRSCTCYYKEVNRTEPSPSARLPRLSKSKIATENKLGCFKQRSYFTSYFRVRF